VFNIDLTRLKTALYLIASLLIFLIVDNDYLFWGLLSAILFISVYEIGDLFDIEDMKYLYIASWIMVISSLVFLSNTHYLALLLLISVASYNAYTGGGDSKLLKAIIYPILPIGFFFSFIFEYEIIHLIWIIVVVSSSDIGAYIVGKNIGKTPFSETSPNKTLEGVGGALLVGALLGSFVGMFVIDSWLLALIISFVVSFFSIFGDLFESLLKRQANVKDSGNLLPGHGGVLDRLDGFLFALPVFFIILELLK
jgi:phosphatidate cytidylyltransferase